MDLDITLLIQLGLLLSLMVFLSNVLLQPLLALYQGRADRIEGYRSEAGELRQRGEAGMASCEREIAVARLEAGKVLRLARESSEQQKRSQIDAVRQQLTQSQRTERSQLEVDLALACKDVDAAARPIAKQVIAAILGGGQRA